MSDSTLLFLFFLMGLGSMLLGNHVFPWLTDRMGERQLSSCLFLAPTAVALFAGSTVFGLYLIPSVAFVQGTLLGLLSYLSFSVPLSDDRKLVLFSFAVAAVPIFFLVGTLGMQNAFALHQGLQLSGRRAELEAVRSFFLRCGFFAVLLLCFFFLRGNLYR